MLKNFELLFKNFIVFWKRNILIVTILGVLLTIMSALIIGVAVSNENVNRFINTQKERASLSSMPNFSSFQNTDGFFNRSQGNINSFSRLAFPSLFDNFKKRDTDGQQYTTFERKPGDATQSPDRLPLTNATFELWRIDKNSNIIPTYNASHTKKIILNPSVPAYALAVQQPANSGDNFNLDLFSGNPNNKYQNNLVSLQLPGSSKPTKCILFYDYFNFTFASPNEQSRPDGNIRTNGSWGNFKLSPDKRINLVSSPGKLINLTMALNRPAFYSDLSEATKPDLAMYKNQKEVYTNFVFNKIITPLFSPDPGLEQQQVAQYVFAMREIYYDMTFGSIMRTENFEYYFTIFNPSNLQELWVQALAPKTTTQEQKANQGTNITNRNIGYKPNSTTDRYAVNDNQVLVSNHIDQSFYRDKNNIQLWFTQTGPGGTPLAYRIVGKTTTRLFDNTRRNSGIWVSWSTYNRLLKYVQNSPFANQTLNISGRAFLNNQLNINYTSEFSKQWTNRMTQQARVYYQDDSSLSPYYTGASAGDISQRQFILDSLIFAITYLIIVSTVVMIVIVTNRIIRQNTKTLGILKANGIHSWTMISSFASFFIMTFFVSLFIGAGIGYAFAYLLNYIETIQTNYIDYNLHFSAIATFGSSLILPAVGIPIIIFIVAMRLKTKPLFLISPAKKPASRNAIAITAFIAHISRRLPFQQKITLKLIQHNQLKILLSMFITLIGVASLYAVISFSSIFSIFGYRRSANQFEYFNQAQTVFGFNRDGLNLKRNEVINNYAQPEMHSLNQSNLVDISVFQKEVDKYKQIKVNFDAQGTPDIPLPTIDYLRQNGFFNTWVKAKDVSKITTYCDAHSQKCTKEFKKYNLNYADYSQYVNNNYALINNLVERDGDITFGFQVYSKPTDNRMLLVSSGARQVTTTKNFLNFLREDSSDTRNNYGLKPKISLGRMLGNYDFTNNSDAQIRYQTSDSNSSVNKLMTTKDLKVEESFLNPKQLRQYNDIQKAVSLYNLLPPAEPTNLADHYTLNLIPYFAYYTPKGFLRSSLNSIYVERDNGLVSYKSGQPPDVRGGAINVFAPIGTTANLLKNNYAPYYALNKYDINAKLRLDTDPAAYPTIQNLNNFNLLTSNYSENYYNRYFGFFEEYGVYNQTRYSSISDALGGNYRINPLIAITGVENFKSRLDSALSAILLIFIATEIVGSLAVVAVVGQICATNDIILKDNANIINLFRSLGYNGWWIFRRMWIIYFPVILISCAVGLPVGFIVSNRITGLFSQVLTVYIASAVSYIAIGVSILAVLLIFAISFVAIWTRFKRIHPLYKFVSDLDS